MTYLLAWSAISILGTLLACLMVNRGKAQDRAAASIQA